MMRRSDAAKQSPSSRARRRATGVHPQTRQASHHIENQDMRDFTGTAGGTVVGIYARDRLAGRGHETCLLIVGDGGHGSLLCFRLLAGKTDGVPRQSLRRPLAPFHVEQQEAFLALPVKSECFGVSLKKNDQRVVQNMTNA